MLRELIHTGIISCLTFYFLFKHPNIRFCCCCSNIFLKKNFFNSFRWYKYPILDRALVTSLHNFLFSYTHASIKHVDHGRTLLLFTTSPFFKQISYFSLLSLAHPHHHHKETKQWQTNMNFSLSLSLLSLYLYLSNRC